MASNLIFCFMGVPIKQDTLIICNHDKQAKDLFRECIVELEHSYYEASFVNGIIKTKYGKIIFKSCTQDIRGYHHEIRVFDLTSKVPSIFKNVLRLGND